MKIGERILKERKKKKFTSGTLAKECGLSRSYITLIENSKRMPGRHVIPKLAVALGVKTEVIVNWYLEDLREKLR